MPGVQSWSRNRRDIALLDGVKESDGLGRGESPLNSELGIWGNSRGLRQRLGDRAERDQAGSRRAKVDGEGSRQRMARWWRFSPKGNCEEQVSSPGAWDVLEGCFLSRPACGTVL